MFRQKMYRISSALKRLSKNKKGQCPSRTSVVSKELSDAMQRLENVETALVSALHKVDEVQGVWGVVQTHAKSFCDVLDVCYPEDDAVRKLFEKTLKAPEGDVGEAASAEKAEGQPARRLVEGYVKEIAELKRTYGNLVGKKERMDVLHRRADKTKPKRQGKLNREYEEAKQRYLSMEESVLSRMESTYAKARGIFKTVYALYFGEQRNGIKDAGDSFPVPEDVSLQIANPANN